MVGAFGRLTNDKKTMEKTVKLILRIVFAVLLLSVTIVMFMTGAKAEGLTLAATGTVIQNLGETTTPDTHKVRDVSDALSVLEPSRFPFDTMLRRLKGRRQPARAIKVEWAQVDRLPRTDAIGAAAVEGVPGEAATWTVSAAGNWRTDDIIALPKNLTAPLLIVESVNLAAGQISVRALTETGFGTVPAVALNDPLARIGNSKTENFAPSLSRIIEPAYAYNMVHTYDAVVEVSDHRQHTANYTNRDDWDRARVDNLYDLRKSFEFNNFFGKISVSTDPVSGEKRWTQNGVLAYIPTTINWTIGSLTESNLIDINAQIFTGNNGAFTRMLFADSVLAGDLDKVMLAKMQHSPTRTVAGVEFSELRTRFGRLLVTYHPGFDDLGYAAFGVVLDMNNITKRELAAMEKRILKYKTMGVRDSDAEQYTEKSTIEVTKPDTHFILRGT